MSATLSKNPWFPDDKPGGGIFIKTKKRKPKRLVLLNNGKVVKQ